MCIIMFMNDDHDHCDQKFEYHEHDHFLSRSIFIMNVMIMIMNVMIMIMNDDHHHDNEKMKRINDHDDHDR